MTTLLHVAVSPRNARSRSRRIARSALETISGAQILSHDLAAEPLPPITEAWIASSAEQGAMPQTARLISDLKSADAVVISTPFHNWGMPAALKAWIDRIAFEGETFAYDPSQEGSPYRPLVADKPVLVAVASADGPGIGEGGRLRHLNHLDPHLKTVLGILGMHDVTFAHGSDGDDLALEAAQSQARSWAARVGGLRNVA